ncbi:coiled-coil domain-containing protein 158-like isoform X2 [Myripristis murdjan]|uniref:coiled-coil domain-containing protein 158-like isoform X2 n=1 Tax=Myripristis murdjan TaxID=586833 RepID=UPI0011761583|nr:coiled-coil domain-containing protein 158-like isoform X2 [Myripristis murdjan]
MSVPPVVSTSNDLSDHNNDAKRTDLEDGEDVIPTTEITETRDAVFPRLKFSSLSLDELSVELDRRTRETQRLQEEVENATKQALGRMACAYSISSTSPQHCPTTSGGSPSNTQSGFHQAGIQPLPFDLGALSPEVAQRGISCPPKKGLENMTEDCSQQVSDVQKQLNELYDQHEQQKAHLQQTILELQTKIKEVQMERDALCELSLDAAAGPRQLPPADFSARAVEDLNKTTKPQGRLILVAEQLGSEECQEKAELMLKKHRDRQQAERQASLPQHQVKKLESALSIHKTKVGCLDQQVAEAQSEVEETQRGKDQSLLQVEELESHFGLLMLKMCEARDYLAKEREQKQQLQERITSLGITVESLRKEQEEHNLALQQLDTLVGRVKEDCQAQLQAMRCDERQQWELREEIKALREQLEAAREQLHRAGEGEARLQDLLEQRVQEGKKTLELLEEKEGELQFRQQEAQQACGRLEEALAQCQMLHAEVKMLRLKVDDREKTVEILRLELESNHQLTVQHSRTINSLQHEKSHLSNQLNQHKLEIQQLKSELERCESGLAALEQERDQLQASVAKQRHCVQEATLEKQQLTTQLEEQHMQLLTLTKEHEELQRLHSSKNEEHEGVVLKLRSQLKNIHAELDLARGTLRTLEGADGHGLQVAMGMQKQITARRDQIDSLQGRIQQLEETMEKLYQEKHYQDLENRRQVQEVASVQEEKRQLTMELEALRSKEKHHRDTISKLEATLHKMTESFADCQDFIQLQEQEFFRLKLQHALDLKELQGQKWCTAVGGTHSALAPTIPSAFSAPLSSQQASNTLTKSQRLQESATLELRSLVKELRGVILENHRPHSSSKTSNSSFPRRRSAPERMQRTTLYNRTDTAKEVTAGPKLTNETYRSDLQLLRTAEPNRNNFSNTFSERHVVSTPANPTRHTSPQPVSLDRRSPVYSLLTSDPNSKQL